MSAPWNPEGNPVHFLIELHDVLRGGYDRFLTTSSKNGEQLQVHRQSLETLRLAVHDPINYGPSLDALISETVSFLRNKACETSSEFDLVAVRNLVKDELINALVGLTNRPPVHLGDDHAKSTSAKRKKEVVAQANCQWELLGKALGARQGLLRLLGNFGCAAPRKISARSASGEKSSIRFQDLKPVVPTYPRVEMPSSEGGTDNLEDDYLKKYSPQKPKDINSDPKAWTFKEFIFVCLKPPVERPASLKDPRTAYRVLVEQLEQQLWNELQLPRKEQSESRTFRKNRFVRSALVHLEAEIRFEHGRLLPSDAAQLKTAFEPLTEAVHQMLIFTPAPVPNPCDQKIEYLNLGENDVVTAEMLSAHQRVRVHDDCEMKLGDLIEDTLNPPMAEFLKYCLHCEGVSSPIRAAEKGIPVAQAASGEAGHPKKKRSQSMTLSEANIKVCEYLEKHGKENPAAIKRDEIAKAIGASSGQVSKTTCWKAFQEKRKSLTNRQIREVPLSNEMLASMPDESGVSDDIADLIQQSVDEEDEQTRRHARRHRSS